MTYNTIDDDCCICLNILNSSKIVVLDCDHIFHKDCVDDLIKNNINKCPLCSITFKFNIKKQHNIYYFNPAFILVIMFITLMILFINFRYYDKSFCENINCTRNCVFWPILTVNADTLCKNDYNNSWISEREFSQETCLVYFGKTKCKQEITEKIIGCWYTDESNEVADDICHARFGKIWYAKGILQDDTCNYYGAHRIVCIKK